MSDDCSPRVSPLFARVIATVCVCLMLLLAGVQATHAHQAASSSSDRDCSVCSVIHNAVVATGAYQLAPLFAPSHAPAAKDPSTQTLLIVRLLYIRPPPSV